MRYKVNDKVRIRKDLEIGKKYGEIQISSNMIKYIGKETVVTRVVTDMPYQNHYYILDIDAADGHWGWSEEMLEPITECDFKVGDKVIFKSTEKDKLRGVLTVSDINTDLSVPFIRLKDHHMWFKPDMFLKVPLFKVGQIVQFKNIKEDKWYPGTGDMVNLEDKFGMVAEITMNHYVADKPNQDGCRYSVRDLTAGRWWNVTSAAIKPVSTITTIEDVRSISGDDPGPRGDLGIIARDESALAIAQAVDNVKGLQFKIGDTVLIREDLVPGKKYEEWDYSPEDGMGGWEFAAAMAKYMGKVATITGYVTDDPNYCYLDIDKGTYSWIVNALLHYTPGSDYDLDRTIITNKQQTKQNYENRLQESDPVISGGKERSGCAICYPGSKASIGIGHLRDSTTACKC